MSNQSTKDRIAYVQEDGFAPVYEDEPVVVGADSDDLETMFAKARVVLELIGGGWVITADREEGSDGIYATRRYLFCWRSYAPGRRKDPESEPDGS